MAFKKASQKGRKLYLSSEDIADFYQQKAVLKKDTLLTIRFWIISVCGKD